MLSELIGVALVQLWLRMRLLWCLLVFVVAAAVVAGESHGRSGYSDSWAVEVHGGEEKAMELAEKHGFVYRGPVRGTAYY